MADTQAFHECKKFNKSPLFQVKIIKAGLFIRIKEINFAAALKQAFYFPAMLRFLWHDHPTC